MKFRQGLLLGAAFATGLVAIPAAGWLAPRSFSALLPAAAAQSTGQAATYRLLSLFGDVFERVRADYVNPVPDKTLIYNALNGMLSGLDPHSGYLDPKAYAAMQVETTGEFGGLGLEVTQQQGVIRVISPIDGTPAAKAGIKPGDLIIALDGKSVEGVSLNNAVSSMRGKVGTKIILTVRRPGVAKPLEFNLTREVIHVQVVRSALEKGGIGYIRLSSFTQRTDSGLRKAYADLTKTAGGQLRGIVLDLRNNPGGLLDQAVAVGQDLIHSGEIVSTRARHPQDSQRWDAHGGDITHGLPLVVLVNSGTASAAEIVSGALQDHRRAIIMGTRSFGKGSVQTIIPMPPNGAIRLTTARYYTPSGRSIQGLGITPDIEVRDTRVPPRPVLPRREADGRGTITNTGGASQKLPPRTDIPAIAKTIPQIPPKGWPTYDPTKPATDFQLQEALKVVTAMEAMHPAAK